MEPYARLSRERRNAGGPSSRVPDYAPNRRAIWCSIRATIRKLAPMGATLVVAPASRNRGGAGDHKGRPYEETNLTKLDETPL